MNESLRISGKLKNLASFLPQPLYVVGGFVRDSILGYLPGDIDLACACTPETVYESLNGTDYIVKTTSPKLMTLKIICGDESYEYTTFRRETYTKGHSPEAVESTDSIEEDAKRRDFKANAVYYDIAREVIVDPLGGVQDIKNRLLTCVVDPEKVFSQDGLRLMRLARMSGELGFKPNAETMSAAKKYSVLICDIAPERIRDELDKMLVADLRHDIQYGHVTALRILDEIDVLGKILPELVLGKGMKQRVDFHKYDVFTHIMETVKYASPKIRLPALLHDIAKPACFIRFGKYHNHEVMGEAMAKEIMQRLHYSTKIINWASLLVRYHMYDLKCEARPNTLRVFVQEHSDILGDLLLLKQADSKGGGIFMEDINPSSQRLSDTYEQMKKENVPFSIKELKITGEDLNNITPNIRSKVIQSLLRDCALTGSNLNDREKQLQYIEREAKKIEIKEVKANGLQN